jgi:glycosyltransferase involved in cell wall biosynthesis
MQQIHISVIIPTFNRPLYLAEAVQSILNQTCPAMEIIIIDNASDPEHNYAISRIGDLHPFIRLIRMETNKGPGHARNAGISQSCGNWLLFMDDDDVLSPDYIETCMESIRREENAEMVIARAFCFTKGRPVSYPRDAIGAVNLAWYKDDRVTAMLINTITIGSCLVQKTIIDSLRFREDIWHGEDTLFWFIIMQKIKKIAINNRAFSGVRQHRDQLTRKNNAEGAAILIKETYVRMMLDSMAEKNSWNAFTLKIILQRVADGYWYSMPMLRRFMSHPLYGARMMALLVGKRFYRYRVMLSYQILKRKPPDFSWLPQS